MTITVLKWPFSSYWLFWSECCYEIQCLTVWLSQVTNTSSQVTFLITWLFPYDWPDFAQVIVLKKQFLSVWMFLSYWLLSNDWSITACSLNKYLTVLKWLTILMWFLLSNWVRFKWLTVLKIKYTKLEVSKKQSIGTILHPIWNCVCSCCSRVTTKQIASTV